MSSTREIAKTSIDRVKHFNNESQSVSAVVYRSRFAGDDFADGVFGDHTTVSPDRGRVHEWLGLGELGGRPGGPNCSRYEFRADRRN